MAQTGMLAAAVAVLGLTATLPDGAPRSDLRTTPAEAGQAAAEQQADGGGASAAPTGSEQGRTGARAGGGERPAEVQAAQGAVSEAVRDAPTIHTTRTPVTTTTTSPPTAPAGDRQIAYLRGFAIWLMHPDGSGQGALTDGSTRLWDPDWAPDGRSLIAQAQRDDATGDTISWFVRVGLDGTVTRLTPDGHDRAPKWSPDGSRIAFARRTTTHLEWVKYDLWVMNPDGSGQRKLATDIGWQFSWAPDGSRLAYHCQGRVCTMRPDGSDVRTLPEGATVGSPIWSPDGQRLVGVRQNETGRSQVVSVRLDGTDRRLLADVPALELDWSADGRYVVFSSNEGNNECQCGSRIWRVGADGSDLRTLTKSTKDQSDMQPAWRP